ncbi:MutS domain V [Caloranaerobacter azorensis DSM 13643]|uniref:MutS domain V n=1 Tax=Caloranaerobacter azorensis DSM 13643 TaxID=1121264 RepID=A0A1M5SUK1_9FIRM|nr:DNA mismatch repair protein MutS [Caloranaerobacter azorensis]SHH41663.1 MutS domain V [Caloranaerobacter azorensis DSM 13643]
MSFLFDDTTKKIIGFNYVMDKIKVITPFGYQLKEKLTPYMPGEEDILKDELDRVETLINLIKNNDKEFVRIKILLEHFKDLSNSVKNAVKGSTLTLIELFEMKNFIFLLKRLHEEISKLDWDIPLDMRINRIEELEALLDPRNEGIMTFYIYEEYSDRLKEIREYKKKLKEDIKSEKKKIREKIKKDLKLNVNLKGEIIVSKDDTELIKKIGGYPFLIYSSETYMNIKYVIKSTPVIDRLEKELEKVERMEEDEEYNIRKGLSKEISKFSSDLLSNMNAIGKLDLTIAKAYMAIEIDGVKPEVKNEYSINIVDGRHIEVEDFLKENGKTFTPISIDLSEGVTCITGANMGGKTVTLKLIALLSAMVQYGLFVPCKRMESGLNGFIYVSIGDLQSIDKGLSTFGGEISKLKYALTKKDDRGLILLDELARGTNPEEGYAISKAIVNFLKNSKSITVITTHYDNIANSDDIVHFQVIGLANVNYDELREKLLNDKIDGIEVIGQYMDYRLKRVTDKSQVPRDAINIARLMGLNEDILKEAEEILKN